MNRKRLTAGIAVRISRHYDGIVHLTDADDAPLDYETVQRIADAAASERSQRSLDDLGSYEIQCLRIDAPELAYRAALRQRLRDDFGAPYGCRWSDQIIRAALFDACSDGYECGAVLRWLLENTFGWDPIGITSAELQELVKTNVGHGNQIRLRGLVVQLVKAGFVRQRGSGDKASYRVDARGVDAACRKALERRPELNRGDPDE